MGRLKHFGTIITGNTCCHNYIPVRVLYVGLSIHDPYQGIPWIGYLHSTPYLSVSRLSVILTTWLETYTGSECSWMCLICTFLLESTHLMDYGCPPCPIYHTERVAILDKNTFLPSELFQWFPTPPAMLIPPPGGFLIPYALGYPWLVPYR